MDEVLKQVLHRRGGVARASEFAEAGVTRGRLRGALRRGEVVRLAPRLFAAPGIDLSRDTDRWVAALAQGGVDASCRMERRRRCGKCVGRSRVNPSTSLFDEGWSSIRSRA